MRPVPLPNDLIVDEFQGSEPMLLLAKRHPLIHEGTVVKRENGKLFRVIRVAHGPVRVGLYIEPVQTRGQHAK